MSGRVKVIYMQGVATAERLKTLGISTARFAKMVGISQPAMRLILKGANKPRSETAEKMKEVLERLEDHACPTCKRALLDPEDDDADSQPAKQTQASKNRR